MLRARLRSLRRALTTLPSRLEWLWCGGIAALYFLTVGLLGIFSGFLNPGPAALPGRVLPVFAFIIALKPCLLEELVYRGLFVPHREEKATVRSVLIQSAVSLAIFIAAHPLNGRFLRPQAFDAFSHPVFLVSAGLLGLVCTLTYRKTGSIYPAVVIHWLTVFAWIPFLGGKHWLE